MRRSKLNYNKEDNPISFLAAFTISIGLSLVLAGNVREETEPLILSTYLGTVLIVNIILFIRSQTWKIAYNLYYNRIRKDYGLKDKYHNLKTGKMVRPSEIKPGDVILLKNGDKVPADMVIIQIYGDMYVKNEEIVKIYNSGFPNVMGHMGLSRDKKIGNLFPDTIILNNEHNCSDKALYCGTTVGFSDEKNGKVVGAVFRTNKNSFIKSILEL